MFSLFIIYFGILLFLNSPKFSKILFLNILISQKCNKITQIIVKGDYLTCLLFRSSWNCPVKESICRSDSDRPSRSVIFLFSISSCDFKIENAHGSDQAKNYLQLINNHIKSWTWKVEVLTDHLIRGPIGSFSWDPGPLTEAVWKLSGKNFFER